MGIHKEQFECKDCQKLFACQGTLKMHREEFHIKTVETTVICEDCGLKYSNKRNLKNHQETHHQKTAVDYTCRLCENIFQHTRSLRRHYLTHHKIVPIAYLLNPESILKKHNCQVCSKNLERIDTLTRHQRQKTCSHFVCHYSKTTCKEHDSLFF